jgi:hypothetical protein
MGSTLITAGILLGITFLFIFIFSMLHKKGKKAELEKRRKQLEAFLAKHRLTLTQKEEMANQYIGLDVDNHKLIYQLHDDKNIKWQYANLQQIRSTQVVVDEKTYYEERGGNSVPAGTHLSSIMLVLSATDAKNSHRIDFFKDIYNGAHEVSTLKSRAAYWEQLINDEIRKTKNLSPKLLHD